MVKSNKQTKLFLLVSGHSLEDHEHSLECSWSSLGVHVVAGGHVVLKNRCFTRAMVLKIQLLHKVPSLVKTSFKVSHDQY